MTKKKDQDHRPAPKASWAEEVKGWRQRAGLTQEQAAAQLQVQYRTYAEWEQGRSQPPYKGALRALMERVT